MRGVKRVALAILLAAAVSVGGSMGLAALLTYFTGVWGVTADNVQSAPAAIRFLYRYFSDINLLVQGLVLFLCALALSRAFKLPLKCGRGGRYALWGAAGALALTVILRALDLTRFGWALNKPAWSWGFLLALAARLMWALGGEALYRGVILSALPGRKWIARAVSALSFSLLTAGAGRGIWMMNAALLGLLCCLIAEESGGIGGAALLRFAAGAVLYPVMGCAGAGNAALYETYARALYIVSGGNYGPMDGLAATALLLGGCAILLPRDKRA